MRGLGAARFCSPVDLIDEGTGQFDVVIDTIGGPVLEGSYGLLREGGCLVTLSAPPDQDLAARHKIHAMFFIVAADPDLLAGQAGLRIG